MTKAMASKSLVSSAAFFSHMSFDEAAQQIAGAQGLAKNLPPVWQWQPQRDRDSHMVIEADGTWYHRGERIARSELVRLFSTILRHETDGRFALVTPHERQFIAVADTPFQAVEMKSQGEGQKRRLLFRTNVDEIIMAGKAHPLSFAVHRGGLKHAEPRPSLHVRGPNGQGLEARLSRALYYELVEMALVDAEKAAPLEAAPLEAREPLLALWSQGVCFPLEQG